MSREDIASFVREQLAAWPLAQSNHDALARCLHKNIYVDGCTWHIVYNPARVVSTCASIEKKDIEQRSCFLCGCNRPLNQASLTWRDYEILVNPYPIFPGHLTIASRLHIRQQLLGRESDIVALARELQGYTVFYNGPYSGASAPDHCHFQAVPHEYLPIDRKYPFLTYYIYGKDEAVQNELASRIESLDTKEDDYEPRINVAVHALENNMSEAVIVCRRAHRPCCYERMHISPGAIDMFGTVVTVRSEDFYGLDSDLLHDIFAEVALPSVSRKLRVGILTGKQPVYTLNGDFSKVDDIFVPCDETSSFTLENVTIGVDFHWQRREAQSFTGSLQLMKNDDGTVTAVNIVDVEDYLKSVISSEMSATAPLELLKAHAVISRSWVLAQLDVKKNHEAIYSDERCGAEIIRWYDHTDHKNFDVCADDHCQRYQGVTRIARAEVSRAVMSTQGEVLVDNDGHLCDARFSKCCGGVFEEFENCWEPVHHSYLEAGRDTMPQQLLPDLTDEREARRWILSRPQSFCDVTDPQVLGMVMNDYDHATNDYYRWRVEYGARELSELVKRRSGIDFGLITALEPVQRGKSGRIMRLRIVGTRRSIIVGKELEIRRWLSESHLYSSAFVVDRKDDGGFCLTGAGWGHGVGLCQIGAAMMALKGHDYITILKHYFHGARLRRMY